VVSDDSARKAARRNSKICTGFNPTPRVKEIFDHYRDEADKADIEVGPEHLALRRRVVVAASEAEAKEKSAAVAARLQAQLAKDPRATLNVNSPTGAPVPDDTRAPKGFAPLAIGLVLTLIHLVSIPIDNTSVNPARSIGPALFAGGWAIGQLWLFILAPIAGGLIAGGTYAALFGSGEEPVPLEVATEG